MASTLRFDVTANDNASGTFTAVAAQLRALREEVDRLDGRKVKVKVDVQGLTTAQIAQISAMKAALDSVDGRNARAKVDVQGLSSATIAQLGATKQALDSIDGRNIKVKIDVQGLSGSQATALQRAKDALRDLDGRNATARVSITGIPGTPEVAALRRAAKALRELDGLNANATVSVFGNLPDPSELRRAATALQRLQGIGHINIHITVTGATEALATVTALGTALRRLPNNVNTDVNVNADRTISGRLAAIGKAMSAIGAAGGVAAIGAVQATAAVASLAGSLASLAGLAPIAVAGLVAGGAAAATLVLGLKGVGDALKESDPKAFAEALKTLAPNAQQFAVASKEIAPAWKAVQMDVQNKLFSDLGGHLKTLSATYLPSVRSGLGGIATGFNAVAKDVVAFATSSQTVRDVDTIFVNTKKAIDAARPSVTHLATAFRDVAVVGSTMLPELATGWTNATAKFANFIAEARQSGQLKVWIQEGIATLQTLGSIAGNVGGILGSVFTAAKASGADFLGTLDRLTGELENFLKSAQGQSALVAMFTEVRATIDLLLPGLRDLAQGAADAVRAFSESGGLQTAAAALSDIAARVAPLGELLGRLAGETLGALASGASTAAAALQPMISIISGVVDGLGGLAPLILASVVAFKALGAAGAGLTALGARVGAAATALGVYTFAATGSVAAGTAAATAATRLGTVMSSMGKALPFVGVALIGLAALMEEFGSKAEESAQKVLAGSITTEQAMAKEIEQVERNNLFWFSATQQQEAHAAARQTVTDEINKQYAAMSPMQQLQADVARAQAELNNAVAQFGQNSPQATAAATALEAANSKLKAAHTGAAAAADAQRSAEERLGETLQSQVGAALNYAEAVRQTAEAHKAAQEALKQHGASSDEYKAATRDVVRAMLEQADAAKKQAEAWGGADAGIKAYNTEILRSADLSTQAGRDAFTFMASNLDNAGLAALSAAARMSGLRTEIMTLPDGRQVTVVVAADQGKLPEVRQQVENFVNSKYVGTVTIDGESTQVGNKIQQAVILADGTRAIMHIDAESGAATIVINGTKYTIDSTTGTMKILGDPAPGEADLSGFKLLVDSTTGTMRLAAANESAVGTITSTVALANGQTGTITLDGNDVPVNGKVTGAIAFADGSTGTVTLDARDIATGKVQATITYANGSTGTVTINARDLATPVIDKLKQPTSSTHTVNVTYYATNSIPAAGGGTPLQNRRGGGIVGYSRGGIAGARRARSGMVLPGYAPGHDTELSLLSRGEAVLVPELVRALGARLILGANREASGGRRGNNTGLIHGIMNGTLSPQATPYTPMSRRGNNRAEGGGPERWRGRHRGHRGLDRGRRGGSAVESMALMQAGAAAPMGVAQAIAGLAPLLVEVKTLRNSLTSALDRAATARPITVEDRSGDPRETARAVQLALR